MPPVIVAAVISATITGIAFGIEAAILVAALSAASFLLTPKPKKPNFPDFASSLTVTVRDPVRARDLVYGRARSGGVVPQ